ncbi:MAG: porin [Alphaproteobacteria bacterium HGW-Alphaproteobacteria-1]|jgi:predicted porin|nr:MAG: porin [Alphaproteobacteria bacterium HGW-Alphaproteobacteria-1]
MKQHLLGTSAIALGVALGAPASAQEWNMKWGGFYNFHVAYSSFDSDTAAHVGTDFDGVGTFTNAEIHFKPSITLDNGLTFGIDVQYEALNTGGATVDESFLSISSDTLGRIDLGNENSAGYKMMVSAPQVKGVLGINTGTLSGFIPLNIGQGGNLPWNFRQAAISSGIEVLGNNDVPRITYYTPSFNGLTLGVSYAANSNVFSASSSNPNAGNNGGVNRNIGVTDIWDIGLVYKQSFNGVDVNLAARYGTAENNTGFAGTDDPDVWAVGATLGYAGWSFGGHYGENDNGGLLPDQEGWSLGVTYDLPGPWDIGFDTFQGEWDDNIGGEAEYEAYQLAASRSLGKGVRWAVYAIYAEGTVNGNGFNNVPAPGVANSVNANTQVEGTIIATSINLSF